MVGCHQTGGLRSIRSPGETNRCLASVASDARTAGGIGQLGTEHRKDRRPAGTRGALRGRRASTDRARRGRAGFRRPPTVTSAAAPRRLAGGLYGGRRAGHGAPSARGGKSHGGLQGRLDRRDRIGRWRRHERAGTLSGGCVSQRKSRTGDAGNADQPCGRAPAGVRTRTSGPCCVSQTIHRRGAIRVDDDSGGWQLPVGRVWNRSASARPRPGRASGRTRIHQGDVERSLARTHGWTVSNRSRVGCRTPGRTRVPLRTRCLPWPVLARALWSYAVRNSARHRSGFGTGARELAQRGARRLRVLQPGGFGLDRLARNRKSRTADCAT